MSYFSIFLFICIILWNSRENFWRDPPPGPPLFWKIRPPLLKKKLDPLPWAFGARPRMVVLQWPDLVGVVDSPDETVLLTSSCSCEAAPKTFSRVASFPREGWVERQSRQRVTNTTTSVALNRAIFLHRGHWITPHNVEPLWKTEILKLRST